MHKFPTTKKNTLNRELNLKGRRMKRFECDEEGYSRPQDTSEGDLRTEESTDVLWTETIMMKG